MTPIQTAFLSEEDTRRLRDLVKRTKKIQCFSFEGVIFIGNAIDAAFDFIQATSYPSDFFVWLNDNRKQLEPIK